MLGSHIYKSFVIIIWVCRKLGKTNNLLQRIRDWRGLLDRYLPGEVIPEGFRWQFGHVGFQ